jgi:hypothetical protein
VVFGLAAIAFPARRLWPGVVDRTVLLVIGAYVTVVWAIYCAWNVFDSWLFSRFLLPSWPFMMLGVGAVAAALFRSREPLLRPAVVCAVLLLGASRIGFAIERNAFAIARLEHRNVVAAQLVQRLTEPNSVIVTMIHSGTLRYYGERMTLNFNYLDGPSLDRAVEWLSGNGVRTYAVVEDWELPDFRQRFAGSKGLAALERPPIGVLDDSGRLLIFDLSTPTSNTLTPVVTPGVEPGWSAVPPGRPPQLVLRPAR